MFETFLSRFAIVLALSYICIYATPGGASDIISILDHDEYLQGAEDTKLVPEPPKVFQPADLQLRALNKVSGRVSSFSVQVGEKVRFQNLLITPVIAYQNPPEDVPEIRVFLEIEELDANQNASRIFSGWMFSSSPSSSAMEHPVYDVWVSNNK